MRLALWDDCPVDAQEREMDEYLSEPINRVFLAERPDGGLCGFLEAAIHPWAVGCEQRPVGYIEGWYVDADVRQQGVGRALVAAAEAWARSKGCQQMASDAQVANRLSQQAHTALGYEETYRLVFFKKELG
jgi:aminoglycoside 6'-N-acetyltransferase I